MKMLAVILLMLVAVAGVSANDKEVVTSTDHITGKTTTVLKPIGIGVFTDCNGLVQLGLSAVASDDGKIVVLISSSASCWQFLRGADVHVLADGQRFDLGHFDPGDGTADSLAFTHEAIGAHVDLATLAKMGNAKDLEIEVGRWQCKVKPKNAHHLKEFVDAVSVK